MRPASLLRRFLGLLLIAGVLLSTLGMAHAPCGEARGGPAAASAAGHGDHAMPDGCSHEERQAPARHDDGGACPLMVHCGVPMLPTVPAAVAPRHVVRAARLEAVATLPASPVLAPESPPPRA